MHFGAYPGPSATLEGLRRTSACSNITLETAKGPGLREGAPNGFRVALSSGTAHRERALARQLQGVS